MVFFPGDGQKLMEDQGKKDFVVAAGIGVMVYSTVLILDVFDRAKKISQTEPQMRNVEYTIPPLPATTTKSFSEIRICARICAAYGSITCLIYVMFGKSDFLSYEA